MVDFIAWVYLHFRAVFRLKTRVVFFHIQAWRLVCFRSWKTCLFTTQWTTWAAQCTATLLLCSSLGIQLLHARLRNEKHSWLTPQLATSFHCLQFEYNKPNNTLIMLLGSIELGQPGIHLVFTLMCAPFQAHFLQQWENTLGDSKTSTVYEDVTTEHTRTFRFCFQDVTRAKCHVS